MNKSLQMLINEAYRLYSRPAAIRRERARWTRITQDTRPSPRRVYYGIDSIPTRTQPLSGGLVKCQDLQDLYPNTPQSPDLLYLVSSALPIHADILIQFAHEAGAKVVLNQNGVAYPAWHGKGWQKANRPLARVHSRADYIFYQSNFCQLGAEHFLGKKPCPSEVLYNPVDAVRFTPAANPPPLTQPILLMAGSHHSFYRVSVALDALPAILKQYPQTILMIAGHCRWRQSETECHSEASAYAKTLGLFDHLCFTGSYTQEEAPSLFHRAHVLLHPKYNDPCPRLVVEAMACGLPVAYSATGGTPELVGNDGGIGVPGPFDWEQEHPPAPADFATAVIQLLARYDEFSKAARQRVVNHLTLKPWLERHDVIFNALLNSSGTSR